MIKKYPICATTPIYVINIEGKNLVKWTKAAEIIAKSGATMVRINGQLGTDMELIDQEVGLCNKYGLKIIMTFIPSRDCIFPVISISTIDNCLISGKPFNADISCIGFPFM